MFAKWVVATIGGMFLLGVLITASVADDKGLSLKHDAKLSGNAHELSDSELANIDAEMGNLELLGNGEPAVKRVNSKYRRINGLCATECITKINGNRVEQVLSFFPTVGFGLPN